MSTCINCGALYSYYDRIVVEGRAATITLELKCGRVCRGCHDTTRTLLKPVVEQRGHALEVFFSPV